MLTLIEWRKRCNDRKRGTNPTVITEEQSRLLLYSIGLGGESGEILEHAKKHVWHDQALDKSHLLKEMGDVLWYLDQLAQLMGYTLEEVATANDEKLAARHPDGFSAKYHRILCQCGYTASEHVGERCPQATEEDFIAYYAWMKNPHGKAPRYPYFTVSKELGA